MDLKMIINYNMKFLRILLVLQALNITDTEPVIYWEYMENQQSAYM